MSTATDNVFNVSINNNGLAPDGTRINYFIVTHSQKDPVVTIADNDGFPTVYEYESSPNSYQGQDGINVVIVFSEAAPDAPSNAFITLNIFQDEATKPYLTIPRPRQ